MWIGSSTEVFDIVIPLAVWRSSEFTSISSFSQPTSNNWDGSVGLMNPSRTKCLESDGFPLHSNFNWGTETLLLKATILYTNIGSMFLCVFPRDIPIQCQLQFQSCYLISQFRNISTPHGCLLVKLSCLLLVKLSCLLISIPSCIYV